VYAPVEIDLAGAVAKPDKAILFVNGYQMGTFWPERGPQTRYFVPDGVLRPSGADVVTLAVIRRGAQRSELGPVVARIRSPVAVVRITAH
jgi:hypothetical protein